MAILIYGLCAITAALCALLLLKAYSESKYKLLLWGGLCFLGFTINNVLLICDKLIAPIDFLPWRLGVSLVAMTVLLYGLIWESE